MPWYRTLQRVVLWIVLVSPILSVSPMTTLAGPLQTSLPTSQSSTAHHFLNLESVIHPYSLSRKIFSSNVPPPRPSLKIAPPSNNPKESVSRPALIRHGASHALHGTKPLTLWSRAGGRARQALWRAQLRWITPVLDTIVHPSTTRTGNADVAPTLTWTKSNPAPARAAPGYARGRFYAHGYKSRSTSSAFPTICDVGEDIQNWITSVVGRLLLITRAMVNYASHKQQQLVSIALDFLAGLVPLLSSAANCIWSILNNIPRTSAELLSIWNSLVRSVPEIASQVLSTAEIIAKSSLRWCSMCFAVGQKLVVENWPTSEELLSALNTVWLVSYAFARSTVSNALATFGTPPQGHQNWLSACIWILKRFFVSVHLPTLVVFWSSWALYNLFDRFGPSFEWCLLPFIGFNPRVLVRQIRRMMQPRYWNTQDLIMCILSRKARKAEGDRRRRQEPHPEPETWEGTEWEFEEEDLLITNGEANPSVDVMAWLAQVQPGAAEEA